jgi:hypothetical protein
MNAPSAFEALKMIGSVLMTQTPRLAVQEIYPLFSTSPTNKGAGGIFWPDTIQTG